MNKVELQKNKIKIPLTIIFCKKPPGVFKNSPRLGGKVVQSPWCCRKKNFSVAKNSKNPHLTVWFIA